VAAAARRDVGDGEQRGPDDLVLKLAQAIAGKRSPRTT